MRHADRPVLAIALRLASAIVVAISFVLVKLAGSHQVGLPQLMFWRFMVSAAAVPIYLGLRGQLGTLRTGRLSSHFVRGFNSTTIMALNYWATMVMPLALVTTLNFTTPLFAVLIAAIVMRQPVSRSNWLAVMIGLAGVVLVARPSPSESFPLLGAAAALAAAGIAAVTNMQVRDLARTEPALTITFYFSLFGALLAACALPFSAAPAQPGQWLLLIGVGLSGMTFQVLMALSLQFGRVATVLVMDYSVLIWVTLAGWLIWNHLPVATAWLGAPLIIGSGLVVVFYASTSRPDPTAS